MMYWFVISIELVSNKFLNFYETMIDLIRTSVHNLGYIFMYLNWNLDIVSAPTI